MGSHGIEVCGHDRRSMLGEIAVAGPDLHFTLADCGCQDQRVRSTIVLVVVCGVIIGDACMKAVMANVPEHILEWRRRSGAGQDTATAMLP